MPKVVLAMNARTRPGPYSRWKRPKYCVSCGEALPRGLGMDPCPFLTWKDRHAHVMFFLLLSGRDLLQFKLREERADGRGSICKNAIWYRRGSGRARSPEKRDPHRIPRQDHAGACKMGAPLSRSRVLVEYPRTWDADLATLVQAIDGGLRALGIDRNYNHG